MLIALYLILLAMSTRLSRPSITSPLSIYTSRILKLRRRPHPIDVEANAVVNLAQSTTHFSWLKAYIAKRTTISSRKFYL